MSTNIRWWINHSESEQHISDKIIHTDTATHPAFSFRMQCQGEINFNFFLVPDETLKARRENPNLSAFIEAYRTLGHRVATLNPIDTCPENKDIPEFNLSRYGLEGSGNLAGIEKLVSFDKSTVKTAAELQAKLDEVYCGNVGAEFSYIESEYEREWFRENYEKLLDEKKSITLDEKRKLATELLQFQEFDRFMNAKLPSIKRYGGEGSESSVAFFRTLLSSAATSNIDTVVLGMPHRGKLNALVTVFKQRPVKILRKYRGLPEFGPDAKAMMDIPNHFSKTKDGICFHICHNHFCSQMCPKISSLRTAVKFTCQCSTTLHISRP